MSPLGHVAIALLARRAIERCTNTNLDLRGMLLGSVLPDLDLALLPFGKREYVHRTFSHSPFFVLVAARFLSSRLPANALFCGGVSHLLLDNFWGGDPPGVAWFFPFDRKRHLLGTELGMRSMRLGGRARAVALELVIVSIATAILLIHPRRNGNRSTRSVWIARSRPSATKSRICQSG